jgi:LemA protein
MWILSLEWLLLALLVFWCTGVFKRLKRARTAVKTAFAAVDAQFAPVVELFRTNAAQAEATSEGRAAAGQHARDALAPSADLLQAALEQARAQPLNEAAIASLDRAWQSTQVAWNAYMQWSVASTEAVSDTETLSLAQRWSQMMTVQSHCMEQFNVAVHDYNHAISQFPACALARVSGHRCGRIFQKDAALLVQQQA